MGIKTVWQSSCNELFSRPASLELYEYKANCMTQPKKDLLEHPTARNRVFLGFFMLVVIVVGLASRKYPFLFPHFLGKYPGDVLWSMLIYLGIAFLKPMELSYRIASYAFFISGLDELSQLIQLPWLNAIRQTTIGHLILGTVFSWNDIFAYAVGIIIAFILDIILFSEIPLTLRSK